ncbi:L,D-transpeptidase family protein [Streptomyces sp. MTZ3.1]|uniref:L,D-transpeptidase family protein n=2 Tax=Streptomyces meridianus TaxID=2938945 RepID=A0ABT0XAJ3_9ACTN|nr:L,D-transpeptidase family protein [Streptomyces meridianus]MCM2579556.1 L,D-transpeptidase family protein [Streptomyces meridianus]
MGTPGFVRTAVVVTAGMALLTGCGLADGSGNRSSAGRDGSGVHTTRTPAPGTDLKRIPGVRAGLLAHIPETSRQVVTVHGEGVNSADSRVSLYTRHGDTWDRTRTWAAHNGKRGWTTRHREGDKRSPVGVFGLSDAGGVLAPPSGTGLPYHRSGGFAAPRSWPRTHWHDFDYVIAIDYNRVTGRSPADPARPQGQERGGSIWLHLDHGSGTSGCVSLSKPAMTYLLRTLEPAAKPVVVMGDGKHLRG